MKKGFTLIELLIVLAIIAILAVVAFAALDPLKRLDEAHDATRWKDVSALLDAVKADQVDNGGATLAAISGLTPDLTYMIGSCATRGDTGCTAQTTQATCANLSGLVTEGYIEAIPQDPKSGSAEKTEYYVSRSSSNVVTIGACDPEGERAIMVSR